jgi:hypothetical protein
VIKTLLRALDPRRILGHNGAQKLFGGGDLLAARGKARRGIFGLGRGFL